MSMKCTALKTHFYIEKLGFGGVYLIFLIQNIHCVYSLKLPHCMFWVKIFKIKNENFQMKFSIFSYEKHLCILNGQVFIMRLQFVSCVVLNT